MKLKVYSFDEDKKKIIPVIVCTIVFSITSFIIFYIFFNSKGNFIEKIGNNTIILFFGLFFIVFDFILIYFLIKPPKKYLAKLTVKKNTTYKEYQITKMKFIHCKGFDKYEFNCYTIEENDLVEGNNYIVLVKDVNNTPRYIEQLNEDDLKEKQQEQHKKKKERNYYTIILEIVLGIISIIGLIGTILFPENVTEYVVILLITYLVGVIPYKFLN